MGSNPNIQPCCAETSNLEEKERRIVDNLSNPERPGQIIVRVCKVCSRRHIVLKVNPEETPTGYQLK